MKNDAPQNARFVFVGRTFALVSFAEIKGGNQRSDCNPERRGRHVAARTDSVQEIDMRTCCRIRDQKTGILPPSKTPGGMTRIFHILVEGTTIFGQEPFWFERERIRVDFFVV